MLLVNDDDDVGFSLAFLYDSAMFCVFNFFLNFFCACGCVHDKLAQYAFALLQ